MCQPTAAPESAAGFWRPEDNVNVQGTDAPIYRPDVYSVIEKKIGQLDAELRELSLDIHGASPSFPAANVTPGKATIRLSRSSGDKIRGTVCLYLCIRFPDVLMYHWKLQPHSRCSDKVAGRPWMGCDAPLPTRNCLGG